MKINMLAELATDSFTGHLVLESLTSAFKKDDAFNKFVEQYKTPKGHVLDVKLFIEGKEMPLKKIVDLWEADIDRQIEERAKELIRQKLSSACEVIKEFAECRIQECLK